MRKQGFGISGAALVFSSVTLPAMAAGADPCDFASSGSTVFSYEQVVGCYQRVPFSVERLQNIVQVVAQHRSFSDLGEIYDARIQWKQALAALGASGDGYPNDLAMHDALKREHMRFRDVHVGYIPPECYWRMLNAFVPLEFGSMLRRARRGVEQILFVEDAPILPDVYQTATGIDTRKFVGLRVVSINGVPALDYFRRYAEEQKTHQDAGGGLNAILADYAYSLRLGGPFDFVPERPSDTYEFESVDGKRQVAILPWVFALSSRILGESALPPTASSSQFVTLCDQGPSSEAVTNANTQLSVPWGLLHRVDPYRHEVVRRLRARRHPHVPPNGFAEVARDRLGNDVREIIAPTNNARVVQVWDHVTALQVGDTMDWMDVAREGVEYACAHSDRLIVDVRNNNGGGDTVIRWLHHYLFPEDGALVAAGMLPVRLRNDNPTFDEILFNFARFATEFLPALSDDPCTLFLTPGCLLNVDTGAPLPGSRYDWYRMPTHFELRAGQLVALSRQVALPNVGTPEFDTASCAGRFVADDLVFVTNGSNASGGYFLPAAFKGDGVIVNTGGLLGEPMAMGRARGGATMPGSVWGFAAQQIEMYSSGKIMFRHPIAALQHPIETQMEMLGAYRKDRKTLHITDPVEADLHADVWTNLPGSEAFVYGRVLNAVDHQP